MRDGSHIFADSDFDFWGLVVLPIRSYVDVAAMVAVVHGKRSQVRYNPLFINSFCKSSKDGVLRQPEKWWPLFFGNAEEFIGATLAIS